MSSFTKNNVIPLYINSKDRVNINDSTTDFKVQLRKSINNISSLSISNVVIPKNNNTITSKNNSLRGAFIYNDDKTVFEFNIVSGNYDVAGLVVVLNQKFSELDITTLFDLTWDISYNSITNRLVINLVYLDGVDVATWGVEFDYTSMVDVMGVGFGETIAQVFTVSNTDTLSIPTNRAPSLQPTLIYNISSDTLANSINTSYISSLGKIFNISNNNNSLGVYFNQTTKNIINIPLPQATNTTQSIQQGWDVAISSDDNYIASSSRNGVFVFSRLFIDGFWVQRAELIKRTILGFEQVAISGDGSTLAVGNPFEDNSRGKVIIYRRIGVNWNFEAELSGSNKVGNAGEGWAVSLSEDGNVLVAGAPSDNNSLVDFLSTNKYTGAVWAYRKGVNNIWTEDKLVGSPINNTAGFGYAAKVNKAGDLIAVSSSFSGGGIYIFTWDDNTAMWDQAYYVATSNPIALALSDTSILSGDGTTVKYYNLTTLTETNSVTPTIADHTSLATNDDESKLVVGIPTHNLIKGVVLLITFGPLTEQQVFIETTVTSQQGYSVDLGSNVIVSGMPYHAANSEGGALIYKIAEAEYSGVLLGTGNIGIPKQGNSVAINTDSTYTIVGAPLNKQSTGGIWTYVRQGLSWVQDDILIPTEVKEGHQLGFSLKIDPISNNIVAGAPYDDKGRVYIFTKNLNGMGYTVTSVAGVDLTNNAEHGFSVDSYDDYIVVGSPGDDSSIGSITVYDKERNQMGSKLIPLGFSGNPRIGHAVAIYEDQIVASGPENLPNGLVWVWRLDRNTEQWIQYYTIEIPALTGGQLGYSLALESDILIVGSPGLAGNGGVYKYKRFSTSWFLQETFTAPGTTRYGSQVAINQTHIYISDETEKTIRVYVEDTFQNLLTYTDEIASISTSGFDIVVGMPTFNSDIGKVEWTALKGEFESLKPITVPPKDYTIFDLRVQLERLFKDIDTYTSGVITLDDGSSNISVSMAENADVTTLFYIKNITFFDVPFTSTQYEAKQTSTIVDLSINNNIIKSFVDATAPTFTIITNTTESQIFRKYEPGFSIDNSKLIDIQLKNERDQIIDLNGLDWVMTIFATIHS